MIAAKAHSVMSNHLQFSSRKIIIYILPWVISISWAAQSSSLSAEGIEQPIREQVLHIIGRTDNIGFNFNSYNKFGIDSLDVALSILRNDERRLKGGAIYFISKVLKNHQKNLSAQEQNRIIGEMLFEVRKLEPKITIMTLMHFKGVKSDLITSLAKEMLDSPDEAIRNVAAKFFSNEPDPDEPSASTEPPAPAAPPIVEAVPQPPSSSLFWPWGLAAAAGVIAMVLWLAQKAYPKAH